MSWGKRASIIVECLFTAPRFANLSSEHPGRMGATMLGGVKRWLLAMLALALRVAPVPLRAFDSASASWGSGGVGTKGVPVPRKRGVRLACGASNKGQAESERILRRGRGPFRLGSVGRKSARFREIFPRHKAASDQPSAEVPNPNDHCFWYFPYKHVRSLDLPDSIRREPVSREGSGSV